MNETFLNEVSGRVGEVLSPLIRSLLDTPKDQLDYWVGQKGELRRRFEMMLNPSWAQVPSTPAILTASSFDRLRTSPFFADEEVESSYGYPQGYAVKPVEWQAELLTRSFQDNLGIRLDARETLAYSRDLPDIHSFVPESWAGHEVRHWVNWYVVPRWENRNYYSEAVENVLDSIGKARAFCNFRKVNLGPKHLRLSERTAAALQMFGKNPPVGGDFRLIPAQFGLTHRGQSVRRTRVVYAPNEFGLGSFIVGCMMLSHPERLVQREQLHIDCPGDEYSPDANGVFSFAPLFRFHDGKVEFGAGLVGGANERFGSASGFLPAEAR